MPEIDWFTLEALRGAIVLWCFVIIRFELQGLTPPMVRGMCVCVCASAYMAKKICPGPLDSVTDGIL